jgi:hypothetical protein
MGNVVSRPYGELQTVLQLEERDGSMFELSADDSTRGEPEAVAVESESAVQIVDAQRNDGDAWFHMRTTRVWQRPATPL